MGEEPPLFSLRENDAEAHQRAGEFLAKTRARMKKLPLPENLPQPVKYAISRFVMHGGAEAAAQEINRFFSLPSMGTPVTAQQVIEEVAKLGIRPGGYSTGHSQGEWMPNSKPLPGQHAYDWAESSLEMVRMQQVDADPDVVAWGRGPTLRGKIAVPSAKNFQTGGRDTHHLSYSPDLIIHYKDGRTVLEEVKPDQLKEHALVQAKEDWARGYLAEHHPDWEYRIVTQYDVGAGAFRDFVAPFVEYRTAEQNTRLRKLITAGKNEVERYKIARTPAEALPRVSAEVAYGAGSPREAQYPDWYSYPTYVQQAITAEYFGWLGPKAASAAGVRIKQFKVTPGGYETYPATASGQWEVYGDPQNVKNFARLIGLTTHQTEVYITTPNPDPQAAPNAVRVVSDSPDFHDQETVDKFWGRVQEVLRGDKPVGDGLLDKEGFAGIYYNNKPAILIGNFGEAWTPESLEAISGAIRQAASEQGIGLDENATGEARIIPDGVGNDWTKEGERNGERYVQEVQADTLKRPVLQTRLTGLRKSAEREFAAIHERWAGGDGGRGVRPAQGEHLFPGEISRRPGSELLDVPEGAPFLASGDGDTQALYNLRGVSAGSGEGEGDVSQTVRQGITSALKRLSGEEGGLLHDREGHQWLHPDGSFSDNLLRHGLRHSASASVALRQGAGIRIPPGQQALAQLMAKTGIVRVQTDPKGLSVEIGGPVSPEQIRAIRQWAEVFPGFEYEFASGGERLYGGGSLTSFNRDLAKWNEGEGAEFAAGFTQRTLGLAVAMRRAGLLSSPKSHIRNVLSNTAFAALEEASRLPASIADILLSLGTGERTTTGPDIAAVARAAQMAATKGVREAGMIMRGQAVPGNSNVYANQTPTGIPAVDKATEFIYRALDAEDRIAYTYAYTRALAEYVRLNPQRSAPWSPAAMQLEARADALFATFRNRTWLTDQYHELYSSLGETVMRGGKRVANPHASAAGRAALDFFFPFVKTPTNIIARAFEYTTGTVGAPIKLARDLVGGAGMTPEMQRSFARTFGRGAVGLGIIVLGAYLARKKLLTGARPDSPASDERASLNALEATGRQPGSIKAGNQWLEVSGLSPVGSLLVLGATLYEQGVKERRAEESSLPALAGSVGRLAADQPVLKGMQDIRESLTNPSDLGRMAGSMAGSFVPTLLGDIAAAGDTSARQRTSPQDYIKAKLPWERQSLSPRVDVFGRPVPERSNLWNPFNPTTERTDAVSREVMATGARLNKVPAVKSGKPNAFAPNAPVRKSDTAAQASARQMAAGRLAEAVARQMVNNPAYIKLPAGQRRVLIEKAVNSIQARMAKPSPEVIDRILKSLR